MGIGWTLQGVDAVSSARDPVALVSGRVVLGGGLDSDRGCGGRSEACGTNPMRTLAKGCWRSREHCESSWHKAEHRSLKRSLRLQAECEADCRSAHQRTHGRRREGFRIGPGDMIGSARTSAVR